MKSIKFIAPLLIGLAFAAPTSAATQDKLTDAQKVEVVDILRTHLRDHPELIMEALTELQKREEEQNMRAMKENVKSNWAALSDPANGIVVGNPKGDVTIVEFYDYQCGYCKQQHETTRALLAADKNVRYIYRPFPIKDEPSSPPLSLIGAHMAYGASKQGKFDALHHAFFSDSPISSVDFEELFKKLGIDEALMENELTSQTANSAIMNTMELADKIGINGTPTMIINGELQVGILSLEKIQAKVKTARTAKAKK